MKIVYTESLASNEHIDLYDYLKILFDKKEYRYLKGVGAWFDDARNEGGEPICAEYVDRAEFDALLEMAISSNYKQI